MQFRIIVDSNTLEAQCDDPSAVINFVEGSNGVIMIEMTRPDPEPTIGDMQWQQ